VVDGKVETSRATPPADFSCAHPRSSPCLKAKWLKGNFAQPVLVELYWMKHNHNNNYLLQLDLRPKGKAAAAETHENQKNI
jgi:hypothetical protein